MGVNGSKDTADLVNTAAELRRKALPERARRGESGPGMYICVTHTVYDR